MQIRKRWNGKQTLNRIFDSSDRAEGGIRVSTHSKKVRCTISQGLAPNMVKQESIALPALLLTFKVKLRCLDLPEITTSITGKEQSLEESLISSSDEYLSRWKGRKETTLVKVSGKQKHLVRKKRNSVLGGDTSRSCSPMTSLKYCLTSRSEAGLPRRRVWFQPPWRPMSEKIERNLPTYESTVE